MSKNSVVNEIHKNARVNFPRRHVVMRDIDDLWQADLIDMKSLSKQNSGYKYILVIIDTFSKYAWAFPLKFKNKDQVSKAFESILKKGRIPKNLQTDFGTEFYNENFKTIVKKFNINHYSTYSTKKASIVERLIRTLKNKMYKQFSFQGNYTWIKGVLEEIVENYNTSKHRTIGLSPNEVNENNKKLILQRFNVGKQLKILKKRNLKVGDFVRISKYKGVFEKGYTPNWSTEIFRIKKVQKTNPVTYLIEDAKHQPILGSFYAEELQKTENPNVYLIEKVLKRKGNKIFVKWLGFPSSENSWIDRTNIL